MNIDSERTDGKRGGGICITDERKCGTDPLFGTLQVTRLPAFPGNPKADGPCELVENDDCETRGAEKGGLFSLEDKFPKFPISTGFEVELGKLPQIAAAN